MTTNTTTTSLGSYLSGLESVVLDVAVSLVSARHPGRCEVAALDVTKCRED